MTGGRFTLPVVIKKAASNSSAYVPDPPGCIATAGSVEQAETEIRDAILFHFVGLKQDGPPIPKPVIREALFEA